MRCVYCGTGEIMRRRGEPRKSALTFILEVLFVVAIQTKEPDAERNFQAVRKEKKRGNRKAAILVDGRKWKGPERENLGGGTEGKNHTWGKKKRSYIVAPAIERTEHYMDPH